MSGVILDQDGHQIAGEARQQVAVQAEQQVLAPVQSGAIAGVAGQLMSHLMQLAKEKHPKEYLDFIKDLYNEERGREAKLAFYDAMAKARAEFPPIKKTKHVGFKSKKEGVRDTSYEHEELASVINLTKPILGKYGLSTTFRATNAVNEPIAVTCIVTHTLGHIDDSNRLVAGRDDSGNKNNIQGVKSTTTYLMRYTLLAALGIAAEDDDDDGRTAEVQEMPITPEQVTAMRKALVDTGANEEKFCQVMMVDSVEKMPSHRYEACMGEIRRTHQLRQKVAAEEATRVADAARLADTEQLKTTAEQAARTTTPGGQGRMI